VFAALPLDVQKGSAFSDKKSLIQEAPLEEHFVGTAPFNKKYLPEGQSPSAHQFIG